MSTPSVESIRPILQDIIDTLRNETGASRTTLRMDDAAFGFHIDAVVVEALAPGEQSMIGENTINHRAAATGQWLERNRTLLVQNDFTQTDFPPPLALMRNFGVKAQILAPLIRENRLDGWISIHEAKSVREWSEGDRNAARRATERVLEALARPPA